MNVNILLSQQVSSYKMEHVLLFPSAPVFIMEHHTYRDRCFGRAAVFGEYRKCCIEKWCHRFSEWLSGYPDKSDAVKQM